MHGEGFTEYTSGFAVPVDALVFRRNAAAVGRDLLDVQRMPSHTSLESGLNADNHEFELGRCSNSTKAFQEPFGL